MKQKTHKKKNKVFMLFIYGLLSFCLVIFSSCNSGLTGVYYQNNTDNNYIEIIDDNTLIHKGIYEGGYLTDNKPYEIWSVYKYTVEANKLTRYIDHIEEHYLGEKTPFNTSIPYWAPEVLIIDEDKLINNLMIEFKKKNSLFDFKKYFGT